jgi:AraC family transcriptional regulator
MADEATLLECGPLMMESRESTTAARARSARIGLGIEVRKTSVGAYRHAPSSDHHVTMHAGPPVRISCVPKGERCMRSRGDINVLPAGMAEDWFEDDASDMVFLQLPASLVRLAAEEMGLDPDRAGIAPRCHVRDVQIEHIAWALAAEHRTNSPNGLIYRESLGMALAVHLLGRHPARTKRRAGLSQTQVARVTEYVEAHLAEDLSLLRLARVSGISASHLRALFKRSVGVPVHEYVIQRRVERARALLSRGELPASQIALEAGFSHQSHMARCMRRVLGVTPASVSRSR